MTGKKHKTKNNVIAEVDRLAREHFYASEACASVLFKRLRLISLRAESPDKDAFERDLTDLAVSAVNEKQRRLDLQNKIAELVVRHAAIFFHPNEPVHDADFHLPEPAPFASCENWRRVAQQKRLDGDRRLAIARSLVRQLQVKRKPRDTSNAWLAKALLLLSANADLSLRQIAKEAGCSHSRLSKDKTFRDAWRQVLMSRTEKYKAVLPSSYNKNRNEYYRNETEIKDREDPFFKDAEDDNN